MEPARLSAYPHSPPLSHNGGASSAVNRDAGLSFSVTQEAGTERFLFSGELTVRSLAAVEARARAAAEAAGRTVVIDLTGVKRLDTAGALLINLLVARVQEKQLGCSIANNDADHAKLLKKSVLPPVEQHKLAPAPGWYLAVPTAFGMILCNQIALTGRLIAFMGEFLTTVGGLILRPRRMRWTSLIFHMEQTGVKAVPIVALLTFLIGMVVAYMGAEQLARFGAQVFAVKLLEVTVMREMAVLITAIVVAGRSSSSFTAQIGSMVANEEVAAMRSMGLDPNTLLVAPRVLALMLCLPMLVFVADIAALTGGAAAIWYTIDMDLASFIIEFHSVAELKNFGVGIVKTPFFAMTIGLVGCFQGFRATSSAESVGFLTTESVVQSIFIVILLDALFAIFFTTIGI